MATTRVQCPPVSRSPSGSKLLTPDSSNSHTQFRPLPTKSLPRGDSGYISPAVTPASSGPSPQTPFKNLPVQFKVASSPPEASDQQNKEEETDRGMQKQVLNLRGEKSSRVPLEHRHSSPSIPEQRLPFYDSFQNAPTMSEPQPQNQHQQPQDQHTRSSIPSYDDCLLLAFKCRQTNEASWSNCPHPYCLHVRNQWNHFKSCYAKYYRHCEQCLQFKELTNGHAQFCTTDSGCPVVTCHNAKRGFNLSGGNSNDPNLSNNRRSLVRSKSFTSADTSLMSISQRAEAIVERLDNEEPLRIEETLSNSATRHLTLLAPSCLPTQQQLIATHESGGVTPFSYQANKSQGVLSPIAESPVSAPQTFDPMSMSQPPLSIKSHYAYSSYEQDGSNGLPSTMSSILSEAEIEEQKPMYPIQTVLHRLDTTYLTPGKDSFYYKTRDYSVNDVSTLGQGGFGSCTWAQDETTELTFAIKQNNTQDESKIESIRTECRVLSRLQSNDHVIRFLGAVYDELQDLNEITPPITCKMMMELAENGNLSELLKDEEGTPSPLPLDQSLFYLQQILKGVQFLHSNGVLHLDIKGPNILVFDNGRRVKLADFGTAVHISDISSVGKNLKGCTPYYAPPEIIQGGIPTFSADIWGVMCVFVEMLTAKLPGCFHNTQNHHQMMFLIGNYEDAQLEYLVPFSKIADMEPDIEKLFRDVFKKEAKDRPTALELLNHPRIKTAHEYESCFDECYDEEYTEQLQAADANHPSPDVQVDCVNSMERDYDLVPSLPEIVAKSRSARDRGPSQDSGIGIGLVDLDGSFGGAGHIPIPLRSTSSPATVGHTPNDASIVGNVQIRKRVISREDSAFCDDTPDGHHDLSTPQLNLHEFEDFRSLPAVANASPFADIRVQRSFSMGSRPVTGSDSGSKALKIKRRRPSSIVRPQRLTHSNSAPVIRRHSLQLNPTHGAWLDSEGDGERPRLRRTSSEVYVEKGPEIDSPEKVKKFSRNKQTDIEGLLASLRLGPSPNHPHYTPPMSQPITRPDTADHDSLSSTTSTCTSSGASSYSSSSMSSSSAGKGGDDNPPPSSSSRPPGNSSTFDIL